MSKEIISDSRYRNFWSKSIMLPFVLATTLGIYWKKKRVLSRIPKSQRNVLTLKQTVATILFLYANNICCDYLESAFPPTEFLFILEELRVILVENIVTRFLLPVLLILNTRRTLPALWAEKDCERREFFMTKLNLQTNFTEICVVQEVSVVQDTSELEEEIRHTVQARHNTRTETTTLANTATGSNLPDVSD